MRSLFFLLIIGVLAAVAGWTTTEERRAVDEAKCRSYGFTQKNHAFAACLQRIDLARRAERRAPGFRWRLFATPRRRLPLSS